MKLNSICVFCGSRPGSRREYVSAAQNLGRLLVREKIKLIYGGGSVGLMGALADAVLAAGGDVTGVIPQMLAKREVMHPGLTDLRVVGSLHERKAMMADLSDGFIALPGGFGTFEELCEILTWSQLGLHRKPIGILDVADYYAPLFALFEAAQNEKFLEERHRWLVLQSTDAAELIKRMRAGSDSDAAKTKWEEHRGES